MNSLRHSAKRLIRRILPLPVRKWLSAKIGRQSWLDGRYWYSMELLRDWADDRPAEFHHFLWQNHLAYAETYEVARRFGEGNVHPSRQVLFEDLLQLLRDKGIRPEVDVRSVLEVGCSMGYLLHYMEERLFTSALILEGVDIDDYAIEVGSKHLRAIDSRVRIHRADMEELGSFFDGRGFDLVLCAGVLMYLPEEAAHEVVRTMLAHTDGVLALTGPAHPVTDNRFLKESASRDRDHTFVHNLDAMVVSGGGRVVRRRWEGARSLDGNTLYFVFAEPSKVAPEPETVEA